MNLHDAIVLSTAVGIAVTRETVHIVRSVRASRKFRTHVSADPEPGTVAWAWKETLREFGQWRALHKEIKTLRRRIGVLEEQKEQKKVSGESEPISARRGRG